MSWPLCGKYGLTPEGYVAHVCCRWADHRGLCICDCSASFRPYKEDRRRLTKDQRRTK